MNKKETNNKKKLKKKRKGNKRYKFLYFYLI